MAGPMDLINSVRQRQGKDLGPPALGYIDDRGEGGPLHPEMVAALSGQPALVLEHPVPPETFTTLAGPVQVSFPQRTNFLDLADGSADLDGLKLRLSESEIAAVGRVLFRAAQRQLREKFPKRKRRRAAPSA